MREQPISIEGVCNTGVLAGPEADQVAPPDLLIELPHGATRSLHFESLRGVLQGDYASELIKFFYTNTDIGSPETGVAVARGLLAERPELKIRILRSLIPRTFIDCNRAGEAQDDASADVAGQLPAYVTDPVDAATLGAYYQNYVTQAERAYAEVCGAGGHALIVHTYAPRSVSLEKIDGDVVAQLEQAWKPKNRRKWPKRPDVDLITAPPGGSSLAPPELVRAVREGYAEIGIEVAENATYNQHPNTLGARWSAMYPQRVLCIELNRQRLIKKWLPLEPLEVTPGRVRKMSAPLITAMATVLGCVPA